jgi:septal ring factor EnvC (AmiA/AmiB activator)
MNVPEILAISLPTLSVLVGILLNRSDTNRLDTRITTELAALKTSVMAEIASSRASASAETSSLRASVTSDINSLRSDIREIRSDLAVIRNDQREFYRSLGEHEVRLNNLEKQ